MVPEYDKLRKNPTFEKVGFPSFIINGIFGMAYLSIIIASIILAPRRKLF